jgi:hypothetical protein
LRVFVVLGAALSGAALLFPERAPVVSALTGAPVEGVALEHSFGYLVLAPVFGAMDYLTVLTVPQHVSWLVGLFLAFGAWRLVRRRAKRGWAKRVLIEGGALVGFVVALAAFIAAGALAYRPMARLVVDDPDIVVVDFHSHTRASHDGRWDFTAERNRSWHRGVGTHVAFIADHDSVAPVLRAMTRNPRRAGDGTVVLPAREFVYAGQHVVALGTVDPRTATDAWRPDPGAPPAPHAVGGDDAGRRWCDGWPVLIQTIPNDLGRVPVPFCGPDGAGVEAIELLDGDPRGLLQSDVERERILAIADSLGLALVSASNLHGWGAAAASWNLLRIPGWRDMTPEAVGARIESMLRFGGPDAVEVVAYRRPSMADGARMAALGATVSLPVHFAAQRSRAERVSWLVWMALALAGARVLERRRGTQRA